MAKDAHQIGLDRFYFTDVRMILTAYQLILGFHYKN